MHIDLLYLSIGWHRRTREHLFASATQRRTVHPACDCNVVGLVGKAGACAKGAKAPCWVEATHAANTMLLGKQSIVCSATVTKCSRETERSMQGQCTLVLCVCLCLYIWVHRTSPTSPTTTPRVAYSSANAYTYARTASQIDRCPPHVGNTGVQDHQLCKDQVGHKSLSTKGHADLYSCASYVPWLHHWRSNITLPLSLPHSKFVADSCRQDACNCGLCRLVSVVPPLLQHLLALSPCSCRCWLRSSGHRRAQWCGR
jgi:hypothetical protein